jgi:multicomponent Na+:H+ antiporter subunit D
MVLLFASAGVFHHSGIKIPFFAFFAHDSGKRCAEAPTNMLVAMAITAALCIGIGVYPQPLYAILPFQVSFVPYTLDHVVSQLQLLMFSALAFTVLMRTGVYPPELRSTNLDTDWLWRKPGKSALLAIDAGMKQGWRRIEGMALHIARAARHFTHSHHGPDGVLGRPWPTGTMALWATLMLGAYLVLAYL